MIHLVWSGKGYLVPAITFCGSLGMEFAIRTRYHDDTYYQKHGWPILTVFVTSGIIIGLISKKLTQERILRDLTTGELVTLRQNHTFLFIPIKYWSSILPLAGVVFYILAETGKL